MKRNRFLAAMLGLGASPVLFGTPLKKNKGKGRGVHLSLKDFLKQTSSAYRGIMEVTGKQLRKIYDDAMARGIPIELFDNPNEFRCGFLVKEKEEHTFYLTSYRDLYWAIRDDLPIANMKNRR